MCRAVPGKARCTAGPNASTASTPANAIAKFARESLLGFHKLTAGTPERLKNNACHMLLLPGVGETGVAERVDAVQVQLQPVAVSLGLMIGEFHKSNNASGLHNSNFYPLRIPLERKTKINCDCSALAAAFNLFPRRNDAHLPAHPRQTLQQGLLSRRKSFVSSFRAMSTQRCGGMKAALRCVACKGKHNFEKLMMKKKIVPA